MHEKEQHNGKSLINDKPETCVDSRIDGGAGKCRKTKNARRDCSCIKWCPYLALIGVFVAVAVWFLVSETTGHRERAEMFVQLDHGKMVGEILQLPFSYTMKGEHNRLSISLSRVEKVYPYQGRINVVLEGRARLERDTQGRESSESSAALRFSIRPIVVDGGKVVVREPVLDELSVYSEDADVVAILDREKMPCWRKFATGIKEWSLPLGGLSFEAQETVQLEQDGLFVLEKEAK